MWWQVDLSALHSRRLHRQDCLTRALWCRHLPRNRTKVESQPQNVVLVPAPHDQQRVVGLLDVEAAKPKRCMLSAQCKQRARERKGR